MYALTTLELKDKKATNRSCDNHKLSIQKRIFEELSNKRMGELYGMSKQVDFN